MFESTRSSSSSVRGRAGHDTGDELGVVGGLIGGKIDVRALVQHERVLAREGVGAEGVRSRGREVRPVQRILHDPERVSCRRKTATTQRVRREQRRNTSTRRCNADDDEKGRGTLARIDILLDVIDGLSRVSDDAVWRGGGGMERVSTNQSQDPDGS